MQKHRAAAAGDARAGVVIDLDDEIVEMIVAPQPVAALFRMQPHRAVVMAIAGILAPRFFRPDGADGQKRPRSRMPVRAPPQPQRPERAPGRAAVALALVGLDAAASQRDRDGLAAGGQPAAGALTCRGANP